jgi:acyl-CoA thioester hydrolase
LQARGKLNQFSVNITPRSYETDALGHINNNAISCWLEVARVRLLETVGAEVGSKGIGWVLASLHIDFLAETHYGADVDVQIVDVSTGSSSLTIDYELFQRGINTVRARAVMVHLDFVEKNSLPIADELRVCFARYSAEANQDQGG